MNEPASRRADSTVGDFTNPIVTEVPPLIRLHTDDVPPPELVEGAHQRVFLQVACLGQDVE